jgi:hypothetical protein
VRPAGIIPDLVVPVGQAVVTGALLAGTVTVIVGQTDWRYTGNLGALWAGLTLAISGIAWLLLLRDSRKLLWTLERWTKRDLDQDGQVGKPQERLVLLNAAQGQRHSHQRAQDQEHSEFVEFVRRLDVFGTSQRTWEPQIGRADYLRFRDFLLESSYAEWNAYDDDGEPHERRGWSLTMPASEIVKRISE